VALALLSFPQLGESDVSQRRPVAWLVGRASRRRFYPSPIIPTILFQRRAIIDGAWIRRKVSI